jgi:prolipoprotein diacylglyceryltransferase
MERLHLVNTWAHPRFLVESVLLICLIFCVVVCFVCFHVVHNVASPAYGVYISQMIRYSRACSFYQDFFDRGLLLTRKLLNQGFIFVKLKSSLRKFYGRHYDLSRNESGRFGALKSDSTHHFRFLVESVLLICLIFCVVVCFVCFHVVHNVASVSGLFILDCPFGFL